MTSELIRSPEYQRFIAELKAKVRTTQLKAAVAVNTQLIELYWDIGKLITERQKASGWGDEVVNQIARDLTREFKTMKGFSRANLYRMKRFYRFYAEQGEFVAQAVRQIPWGHNIMIFQKIEDPKKAAWYVHKTLENNWARSVLQLQIESGLYERQAESPKIENFAARLPALQSDLARQMLKDPYMLDFLDLGEEAHERTIEKTLVKHLATFMLELGKGFAFVGEQYHLEVGGEDFYLDLLFYHLKLHCYVVIELKNGPFKPEYAGKLNFYLTALDEEVKTPEDNSSIGLMLCKDKNNIVAEYALRGMSQPIGVSEFKLTQTIPEELKTSLPTIEEMEAELGKNADEKDGSEPEAGDLKEKKNRKGQ